MQCCDDKSNKTERMDASHEHGQYKDNGKGISFLSKWHYLCALGLVAAVVALTVFKVSPQNLLFFGILLACPLMHVFMMKGHGGHGHQEVKKKSNN